ncbi:MAG: hypothetical protein ACE5J2_01800 [Nitrososphaerales archaeon]
MAKTNNLEMVKLRSLEITYNKDNCGKSPFMLRFELPLSAHELYLIELPNKIRYEIMNSLDLVISEYYFDKIKAQGYSCYT